MKIWKTNNGVVCDCGKSQPLLIVEGQDFPERQRVSVIARFRTKKGRLAIKVKPDPAGEYFCLRLNGSGDCNWGGLSLDHTNYTVKLAKTNDWPSHFGKAILNDGAVGMCSTSGGGGCWDGWAVVPAEALITAVEEKGGWYGGSWWYSILEDWSIRQVAAEDLAEQL